MPRLSKGKRISGDHRLQVRSNFVERYQSGESIRSIATDSGRSYGFVQGMLKDAGVEFRSRGGARAPKKAGEASEEAADDAIADGGAAAQQAAGTDVPAVSGKSKKSGKKDKSKKDKKAEPGSGKKKKKKGKKKK